MAILSVCSGGFLVTVQDGGRSKSQHLGLAEAGAMDKHALFWGNRLLGNIADTAALEIAIGNTSYQFEKATNFSITGADMGASLNGKPLSPWRSYRAEAGDTIRFGIMKNGLRAYLCIDGGFTLTKFFASASTVPREKTGANDGAKLATGDQLHYKEKEEKPLFQVPKRWIPDYQQELTIRFIPSYHYGEFKPKSQEQFTQELYTVSNEADRMGYRLNGAPLLRDGDNILSIAVPCGAIQIPSAGEPIILLNDRQATGGYPIFGVISQRDIFRLSQRKAGDKLRFRKEKPHILQQELREFYNFFFPYE